MLPKGKESESGQTRTRGLPPMPEDIYLAKAGMGIDWKRVLFIFLGMGLFAAVYFSPPWPDALDPTGKHFPINREGKLAIGLFLLASCWWIFEVLPIGVTGISIGVIQALFHIRDPRQAFTDFTDPSVWFIFGSFVIGLVFTRTGLTKRVAYKMLVVVGERTSMIYLGCFVLIGLLTLIMAHTAVAATVFPLLMTIYSLYDEGNNPSRFGKGLFMGMAYTCGAGSIVTLLGSARAAVAVGFFKDFTGREISFFELSKFMAPLGWGIILVLWVFFMIVLRPERKTILGLRERAQKLYERLGPFSPKEVLALVIILTAVAVMSLRSFVPALAMIDKTAVILATTVLFFVTRILTLEDLEEIPWNIILLFGGAMSIGFCLWQTKAAEWLAVNWLVMFEKAPGFVFVMGIALFVLLMTNFIMNVAAIAISLPVALVIAPYLHVAPEAVFYSALATAGMPFILLIGAAPNAIAYGSKQFTSGEFLLYGIPASILLMVVLGLFVWIVWPAMGMPVVLP